MLGILNFFVNLTGVSILSYMWYSTFYYLVDNNLDKSIVNNCIHWMHASIYVSLYYLSSFDSYGLRLIAIPVSISFFLYDTVYLIYNYGLALAKLPFLLHHFIALYSLGLVAIGVLQEEIMYIFYILELSNIALYLTYFLIKKYPKNQKWINISKVFQLFWYSYFRLVSSALFIVTNYEKIYNTNNGVLYLLFFGLIYMMGVLWTYKLGLALYLVYYKKHDKSE